MNEKVCKRCGETKPLSDFRNYYAGRNGTYRYCKTCEKIQTRYKYLLSKCDNLSDAERAELDKITKLYKLHEAKGLETPLHSNKRGTTTRLVDEMLARIENEEV